MCDPTGGLLIAATALAAIGTGVGAIQTAQQDRYEAKVADANAANQTAAAADAQSRGETTLRDQYRRASALKGEQIAAQSANGIDTNFGSALEVQRDTSMLTQDDALTTAGNTTNEMRGYQVNAANYTAEAGAKRSAATGALVKGAFDVGSTILGGATQYSKLKPPTPKLGYNLTGF